MAWFGHLGFGCDSSDWSERVLEVGEVGVDHVRKRERSGSTSTMRKGQRQNGGKYIYIYIYQRQPKLKINVIKLIKNK